MLPILFIASALSLLYCAVILFLAHGLSKIAVPAGVPGAHKFSVVIAAHNEEHNIVACLESVFSQNVDTTRFEVILVNDRSTDATADLAAVFCKFGTAFSIITITATPAGTSPKKHAVGRGIEAARNEIIVFTDADCTVPATWLESIDSCFDEDTGLVQGITVYRKIPDINCMLFAFQAVDFVSNSVVAAAAIGAGLPLNSNANNFAFRKAAFQDVNGYGKLGAVISGDDDLLLQRIWRGRVWGIRYMASVSGKVTTLPTATLGGLFEQRKRWGSKTVYYYPGQVCLLSIVFLFYLGIAASFVAGFANPALFAVFGGMLFVKILGEALLVVPGARLFGETALLKYMAPASVLQLPMVILAVIFGVFGRFSWKGQQFARTSRQR
jgi:cellulose synthase/poly-beta-1,6-N-acetylglucosamine synthase-like glycosyltransferase